MKKLGKADLTRRLEIAEKLRQARDRVESAADDYNRQLAGIKAPVEAARDAYNEAAEEARGFIQDVVSQMEEYADERAESWHDGDKGQAFQSWKSDWENFEPEDIDLDLPDEINPGDIVLDIADDLEQLPEAPE